MLMGQTQMIAQMEGWHRRRRAGYRFGVGEMAKCPSCLEYWNEGTDCDQIGHTT